MAVSALLLLLVLPAETWPGLGLPRRQCVHCCHPAWPPAAPGSYAPENDGEEWMQLPRIRPTIDISILKGECHGEVWPHLVSYLRRDTPQGRPH